MLEDLERALRRQVMARSATDVLIHLLAARFGCGPELGELAFHELLDRRGPAQGYQEVAALGLACASRQDAVRPFLEGFERLSRRKYWRPGNQETLAVDSAALFALAVSASGLVHQAEWLVDLIKASRERLVQPWSFGLLGGALFLLGHGSDQGIPGDLLAACMYCGFIEERRLEMHVVHHVLTHEHQNWPERAVVQLAAVAWLRKVNRRHLPLDSLDWLVDALIEEGFAPRERRALLLRGIPPGYVEAQLQDGDLPSRHLRAILTSCNEAPNSLYLQTVLRNLKDVWSTEHNHNLEQVEHLLTAFMR